VVWQEDITELQPGARLVLNEWIRDPAYMLEIQRPGAVRLYVHYRYEAGKSDAVKRLPPASFGQLEGVAPFEIVSTPIDMEVVRPLDVVVSVKSALKTKTKTKLSDILEIHLVNRSEKLFEVKSPTLSADARLVVEIRGKGWSPMITQQRTKYGIKQRLRPGERLTMLGEGEFSNGLDGFWETPWEAVVKVRAMYYVSTWKPGSPIINSDWIDLTVEH
jgi:hypothetical protein